MHHPLNDHWRPCFGVWRVGGSTNHAKEITRLIDIRSLLTRIRYAGYGCGSMTCSLFITLLGRTFTSPRKPLLPLVSSLLSLFPILLHSRIHHTQPKHRHRTQSPPYNQTQPKRLSLHLLSTTLNDAKYYSVLLRMSPRR